MAAISDPIADMLTRIRNAIMAGHYSLTLPASKMKNHIAKILQEEGYINNFEFREDGPQGAIHITLNYSKAGKSPILGLKRVSRPGRRVYSNFRDLPRIRNGLGIVILSTSKGVLSDKQARERQVGGEVLCYVW